MDWGERRDVLGERDGPVLPQQGTQEQKVRRGS